MQAKGAIRQTVGPITVHDKTFSNIEKSFGTYLENGGYGEAVEIVESLSKQGVSVPDHILLCLLRKCSQNKNLDAGKRIHQLMVSCGLSSKSFYCDHLIRFYESCDSLKAATFIFNKTVRPTIYTWNAIISAHVKLGKSEKALLLYSRMQQQGTKPGKVTCLLCLKACGSLQNLEYGQFIHYQIVIGLVHIATTVGSALVCMYCNCGSPEDALNVFNGLKQNNLVLWGAMIGGFVKTNKASLAFQLLVKMQQQGMEPDQYIFSSLLMACGIEGMYDQGMVMHDNIIKNHLDMDCVIQNTLVCMYSKCRLFKEAEKLFFASSKYDVISWGALTLGYVEHGEGLLALHLFDKVRQSKSVKPSKSIFSCTLKACASVKFIDQGMIIHDQILAENLESDVVVGNSLLDMYIKCTKLNDAYCIFCRLPQKDIISWGTVVSGFVQLGHGTTALSIVENMQEQDIVPDEALIMSGLKACATERCTRAGQKMHDQIIRNSSAISDPLYNNVVHMYTNCGFLDEAENVFGYIKNKDVVSWSIMIEGCIQHEQDFRALILFTKMQESGIKADKFVHSCCLKACRGIGALGFGRWVHDQLIRNSVETDIVVAGAMVDMYTFCESAGEALAVLARLPIQNEILWGAVIASCAQRGNYVQAQNFLQLMLEQGLEPNDVVMTSVLAVCGHAGLLKEGFSHFESMQKSHGCAFSMFRYSCMVDLLGRIGWSNQANDLMETMPMPPGAFSLAALLTGCRTHNSVLSAKLCFDEFNELNPKEASGYVMMSNILAAD